MPFLVQLFVVLFEIRAVGIVMQCDSMDCSLVNVMSHTNAVCMLCHTPAQYVCHSTYVYFNVYLKFRLSVSLLIQILWTVVNCMSFHAITQYAYHSTYIDFNFYLEFWQSVLLSIQIPWDYGIVYVIRYVVRRTSISMSAKKIEFSIVLNPDPVDCGLVYVIPHNAICMSFHVNLFQSLFEILEVCVVINPNLENCGLVYVIACNQAVRMPFNLHLLLCP